MALLLSLTCVAAGGSRRLGPPYERQTPYQRHLFCLCLFVAATTKQGERQTMIASSPALEDLSLETQHFYRQAVRLLNEGGVPFLVGGAYALAHYTGIVRHTKDFDV